MPYAHDMPGSGKGPRTSDAQLLHAAHHLVDVYLLYLREHDTGSDLFDTRELPASKDALLNAFRVVIATESRPGVRALLTKAGMTLAQFHDDIGVRMSVQPAPMRSELYDGHRSPNPTQIRRFDRALNRLAEERIRLGQIFRHACDIAEKKPVYHA